MTTIPPFPDRAEWQRKPLLICLVLAALLYASWQYPGTYVYWEWLDTHIFFALNGLLVHRSMQVMWGVMNNRAFDLIPALVLLSSFAMYVVAEDKKYFNERVAQGVFMAVYIVAVVQIFRHTMPEERLSPSLVLEPVYRLSQLVPELNPKDHTYESFPGDHATIFILVGVFMYHYFWRKHVWVLWALGVLFCLPRLVAGAHWFSDIAVGALVITLAASSLALHTPLAAKGNALAYGLIMKPGVQKIIHAVRRTVPFLH